MFAVVSNMMAPYEYLFSGKKEIEGTSITNLYDKSLPVYKIVGEGMCDFTVNGNMISVNVGQELIIDTDKKSGIVNDPNDWAIEHNKPSYILDLLLSVINVSMQTMEIVKNLPKLTFEDESSANSGK